MSEVRIESFEDTLLIASDGLWDNLSVEEIVEICSTATGGTLAG